MEISEFIPHFMAFLRSRLLQNNDQQGHTKPYFSPRQKEEQRKAERNKFKTINNKTNPTGRSARVSLQYSSSSPMKAVNGNNKDQQSSNRFNYSTDIAISGISPIKNADQNKRNRSKNSKKPAKVKTKPVKFEINSFYDFPTMTPSGGGAGGGGSKKK